MNHCRVNHHSIPNKEICTPLFQRWWMTIKWVQAVFCRMVFLFEAELCLVLNNILPNAKKWQGRERKINEQINIYFSAIKTRLLLRCGCTREKMILFTFSHPLPHPFIWESKSGETVRSLTQLVSVNKGHFPSVCVFYKILVHCSRWESGGPAAQDWVLFRNRLWTLSPSPSLVLPCHRGSTMPPGPHRISGSGWLTVLHTWRSPGTPARHYRHWLPACGPAWTHTHVTHPPTPTAGNLSPINNSLLPIRNICGTVKTFLLHLQRSRLLMFYRLWKPSRIKHYLKFSWVGVGKVGTVFGERFSLKTAVGFCSRKKCDNIKM